MLEIFLLIYIGKKFKQLSEQHDKTEWQFILLAIATYIFTAIVAVVIILLFDETIHRLALSLISIPVGSFSCYLLYTLLEKNWKNQKQANTVSIDDIGKPE